MRSRVLYVVCVYVALQSVLADGPDKKREILEMLDGSSDDQEVRIVEGIAKLEDTTSSLSDPYQTPEPIYGACGIARVHAVRLCCFSGCGVLLVGNAGPESLFFLDGLCFQSAFEKYEYSVCPFQNVTQRRLTNARSVLLGYVCVRKRSAAEYEFLSWKLDHACALTECGALGKKPPTLLIPSCNITTD